MHLHKFFTNGTFFPSFLINERWYTNEILEKPEINIITLNQLNDINSSSDSDFVPSSESDDEFFSDTTDSEIEFDDNTEIINQNESESKILKYQNLL